jgi:glycosyl transferase family 1
MKRMTVAAIEITAQDHTYAWVPDGRNVPFETKTLFPDTAAVPSIKLLVETIWNELDRVRPMAVAIPGWSAPYALAALSWCGSREVPAVMMSESTADDAGRRWWREKIKGRLVRLCCAAIVGGETHRSYVKQLGMRYECIFTGYDVVDNDYFVRGTDAVRGDESVQRVQHSLPAHYFLASCRFVEKKNLFRLLEAFARYRQVSRQEAWELVLLGDGELRSAVEQRIRILGLSDWVSLPGFKQYDALPVYYGLAGAFIHASTVEQWGLVVNEAMAAGLPVIVSKRCGCVSELVESGRNGFSFDPYDVAALARHMEYIASGKCDRRAMGAASREIIARWSPMTFAENLTKAVYAACAAPASKTGLLDRGLIAALIRR